MKNEHASSTAPLLLGMAAGAALGAAGVMATNTSQRQMRRTARKLAKGAEHAVSQLDKMVGDFVEHKMEGRLTGPIQQHPGFPFLREAGVLLSVGAEGFAPYRRFYFRYASALLEISASTFSAASLL